MTGKALARRIAEVLFIEPASGRGAGAATTRRAARILAGGFVARRSKTTRGFSLLAPRTRPKFAAALLYQPQAWCTTFVNRATRVSEELGQFSAAGLPDRFSPGP